MFAQEQTRTVTTTTKTTWNGTLVDASCQTTRTESRETVRDNNSQRTTTRQTTEVTECPVTTTTTTFGLLTRDGRLIRFDDASNTRVVQILRGNRDWETYLSNRTPLRVSVVGTSNGDVAVVETLTPEGVVTTTTATTATGAADVIFDVKKGDDHGKLVVTSNGVSFENLSNAGKSRSWSYSQIKELKRDGSYVKIEPFSGDSYEFRVNGPAMSDAIYQTIADRIVASRRR